MTPREMWEQMMDAKSLPEDLSKAYSGEWSPDYLIAHATLLKDVPYKGKLSLPAGARVAVTSPSRFESVVVTLDLSVKTLGASGPRIPIDDDDPWIGDIAGVRGKWK